MRTHYFKKMEERVGGGKRSAQGKGKEDVKANEEKEETSDLNLLKEEEN